MGFKNLAPRELHAYPRDVSKLSKRQLPIDGPSQSVGVNNSYIHPKTGCR